MGLVHDRNFAIAATGNLVDKDMGHGHAEWLFSHAVSGDAMRRRLGRIAVEHISCGTSKQVQRHATSVMRVRAGFAAVHRKRHVQKKIPR